MGPDLVTLDLVMLNLDGIGALKGIREFDPNAVVLMISSMGQESMIIESAQLGSAGFIVKPIKESLLISVVNRLLTRNPHVR